MTPTAYLNGRYCSDAEIALTWQDAGLVFGATATDLVRTFNHELFRLADHIERFRRSCALCHIPLLVSDSELATIAQQLVHDNTKLIPKSMDLALTMMATPGPLARFSGKVADGPPTLAMHTYPFRFDRYRRWFAEGARLIISSTRHVSDTAVPRRAKQRSRLNWWIATSEAKSIDPSAEVLLLDENGDVTETASANLIAVYCKELVTPLNCLHGVSLQVVRELAESVGFQFREKALTPKQCLEADELLLTSTTFCLAGVSQLESEKVRWPGPAYQSLLTAYSRLVGVEIAAQG